MTIENSVFEKIQKCLELARRGGTEGEAAAAMARVQSLLAKHNLSLAEVESRGQSAEDYIRNELGRLVPWQKSVWNGIAKMYFCSFYINGPAGILIGKPSNVAVAKSIAEYVCQLGERLAKTESSDRKFRNSFKTGFAFRIAQRCSEEIRKAKAGEMVDESTGRALVVTPLYEKTNREVALFLSNQGVRTGTARSRSSYSSSEGFAAGKSSAEGVSLRGNGIAAGSSRLAIGN
jgi:hypothetical protein